MIKAIIAVFALLSVFHASSAVAVGEHTSALSASPIVETRKLSKDEEVVRELLNLYASAMEKRSVAIAEKAVMPNDFSTIESGYANWTWEDFRDNHLSKELEVFTDVSYKIDLLSAELQGKLGFAIYRYTAKGKLKGQSMSMSGLATAIVENAGQGWRIHHIHSSVPRPAGGHK